MLGSFQFPEVESLSLTAVVTEPLYTFSQDLNLHPDCCEPCEKVVLQSV